MTALTHQIDRIKIKLPGTRSTVTLDQVAAFEARHSIQLPEDFKLFITQIGPGPGPFQGIHWLGEKLSARADNLTRSSLSMPCLIWPGMTDKEWRRLEASCQPAPDTPPGEGRLLGGVLSIGSLGYGWIGLVLNGKFVGRVVYLYEEGGKPLFTYEKNFLDWYERWRDEVIAGELVGDRKARFGYAVGGSAEHLLETFRNAEDDILRGGCLDGLLYQNTLDEWILNEVERELPRTHKHLQGRLLRVLTKFSYERAARHLETLASHDIQAFCECLYYHAKRKCPDWLNVVADNMASIDDVETFELCTHVLHEASASYATLIVPFTESPDPLMRAYAFKALAKTKDKAEHIDVCMRGLEDSSEGVVQCTLHALEGVRDDRLLASYARLAREVTAEKQHLFAALKKRLKELDLTVEARAL